MAVLLVAFLALLVWGVVAGSWLEPRLTRRLIRYARGEPWRGGLAALGLQLAALTGFALASLVAVLVGQLGGRAGVVTLESLVLLGYVPVAMTALPGDMTGYRPARDELQRAGASPRVARAITWSGGPVALVGIACVIGALFAMVDPS